MRRAEWLTSVTVRDLLAPGQPVPPASRHDAQDRVRFYTDPADCDETLAYGYDADGRRTDSFRVDGPLSASHKEYTYDALGNLTRATVPGKTIDYVVDAQGRRIGKRVGGGGAPPFVQTLLYSDGLRPIVWTDEAGATGRFVYGEKANVPDYLVKGGRTYRIVSDHLGSVRFVVDLDANTALGEPAVVQRMRYDEFGRVEEDASAPGWEPVPFGFAGGLYDRDTGLVRFGARDYDPVPGRWTQKDPSRFEGGLNLYAYAANDPVNNVDPTGNVLETAVDIVSVGLSGKAFSDDPSWTNGALLLYDAGAALLPFVPSSVVVKAAGESGALLNRARKLLGNEVRAVGDVGDLANGVKRGGKAPDFVVTPGGTAFPVPKGATGPVPVESGKGVRFVGGQGGANGQVDTMRLMDADGRYPNGYIKYNNAGRQGVDPYTGRTLSEKDAHFPIDVAPDVPPLE